MKNKWLGRWSERTCLLFSSYPLLSRGESLLNPLFIGHREDLCPRWRLQAYLCLQCCLFGRWRQRGHSCYLSAEQKREGQWSQVCLLLHWSNLLFFFPIFWTKLWCRVPELGGSLSGETAVGGALQGCSLPGLLSRLGLRVWGLYMLTKAHWKSLSRQGTLPLTHAKSVWLKPRVLGVC